VCVQRTGRLFVVNAENDADKDRDMVQQLLGRTINVNSLVSCN
jgi:hypothetical protein